jgi:thiol-disulfide isomerase/thioredoxin
LTTTRRVHWLTALGAAALCACGPTFSAGAPSAPAGVSIRFPYSLDDLAATLKPNGKPLVVNHWATWCGPCVEELPYFAEIARRFDGKADFVGVAWDNLEEKATDSGAAQDSVRAAIVKVLVKTGVRFPIVVAPGGTEALAKRFKLLGESVPQTFVFDASGKRVFEFLGELVEDADQAAFVKAIEAASAR